MRTLLFLALLAAAPPDRPNPAPKGEPKSDLDQLAGEWRIEKMEFGGGPAPLPMEKEERTLRFTKSEIVVTLNGQVRPEDSTGYTIDFTKKPIAIDIMPRNGPDKKMEGILSVEGDQMKMSFTIVAGQRPRDFNVAGEMTIVMHLKRIKK
jgi:uncharacterized protein (TIGR03067 family)